MNLEKFLFIHPYTKKDTGEGIRYQFYKDFEMKQDAYGFTFSYQEHIMYKTDPIFVYINTLESSLFTSDEASKETLRNKFNVSPVLPFEEIGTRKLLGLPNIVIDPIVKEVYNPGKKIIRKCLHSDCNVIIESYRSDIKRGKGLFCCKEHTSVHKGEKKVKNTCKTCGFEYSSIFKEEFCCEACKENYQS